MAGIVGCLALNLCECACCCACGPQSGKWGFGEVTTLSPGWTTLTWEESITHAGSPFRIAILDETETARVVLLDHIPHNDKSAPDRNDESTYVPYKISVNIPDIQCDKCSLQLLYVMTDKTVKCGTPVCYYNQLIGHMLQKECNTMVPKLANGTLPG